MHSVGLCRAVADHVIADLAVCPFNCLIDLASWNSKALGDNLEVVDERLHLGLHLFSVGKNNLGRVSLDVALRHSVKGLLADLHRFAHLFHPENKARPDVAIVLDGHLELELLVARVRHVTAQVPVDARCTSRWSGYAERDGVFGAEMADTFEAIDPDGIAGEEILILIDFFRQGLDELLNPAEQINGRLQCKPSDAKIGRHHALAGDMLEDAEDLFTFAEGVEEDSHRADVQGVRAQPNQVRIQSRKLVQEHPYPLGTRRNLDLEQLFDGEAVNKIVRKRGKIVNAVGQRDNLLVELRLAGLLDSGVQISDVRDHLENRLAVDFDYQAENAVGRGVLRSHIHDHRRVFGTLCGAG